MEIEHLGLEPNQLANFRDVAAPGSSIARWVKPAVLWRSDAPHPGDADPIVVRDRDAVWPPRVVIDLREPDEAGPGAHPLAGPEVEIITLPLTGSLTPAEQLRMGRGGMTLAELYRQLLGTAAAWLPDLVHGAAHADGPTLIHCAAGKDRTGVSVAILLALAGVPRAEIVADYLATHEALPRLRPRLGIDAAKLPALEHLLDVSMPAMEAVLDEVGPDPVAFCRDRGVDPRDIESWQRRAIVDEPG